MAESTLAAAIEAAAHTEVATPALVPPAVAAASVATLGIASATARTPAERKAHAEAMLAEANADLAKEAPAGLAACDALELLATAYPETAAVLTPLADKARAGCTEAEFAKAIMSGVAKGSTVTLGAKTEVVEVKEPAKPGATTEAKVDSPVDIYSARNKAMRGEQPATH